MRAIILLLALSTACAAQTPLQGIVLVTLDTTRADRLSPYGYGNAGMPGLDRLAREGVVFDRASTVAPVTLPAHASLFTGLLPPRHGVRENAAGPLDLRFQTLAETLAAAGYRTAGFVASSVLDVDRGLGQGFETYQGVQHGRQRRAGEVVDDAVRWLTAIGNSRFMLWTHFYDPHLPHEAPEPFGSRHDPYVAEIAYADSQLARLVSALDEHRLLDRVAVIVLADHGESLDEHGERDHGVFVYESVLRIPFIVRAPGYAARRVSSLVSVVDVLPTILDLAGFPATAGDGASLVPVMRGAAVERESYAESIYPARFGWAPLFALRAGRFKLIDAPQAELYDLRLDPFEQRNIVADRVGLARAMEERLRTLRGETVLPGARADPDVVARLAALGYVSGPAPEGSASALRDPKECRGVFISGRCVPEHASEMRSSPSIRPRD